MDIDKRSLRVPRPRWYNRMMTSATRAIGQNVRPEMYFLSCDTDDGLQTECDYKYARKGNRSRGMIKV